MTGALFEAVQILLAIALLLTIGFGLGWFAWLAMGQIRHIGRPRPRLVGTEPRKAPGREPTRPRPRLVWHNGSPDLPIRDLPVRDSEPRDD